MIPVSREYPPEQLHDGAVKFQSLYRCYITRKYTILPSVALHPVICDQINVFIKSGKRLTMDVTAEINEGRRFFIKWDKDRKVLYLIFPNKDIVGSGAWKKFFSSNTLQIPLTAKKREIKQFASVWMEADSETDSEIRIQQFLYKRFIEEKPRGVYFLEPCEQIHLNIYTQRRLINRLEETKFNDPFHKSICMQDIARSLIWIHQQGVVHGDVYLKNVLVEERMDEEGVLRLVPYFTDFGSAKRWGAESCRELDDYVRWDICKCFADINTPLMDWHGFIVTNIMTWFPEMGSHLKWDKFISIRERVFRNEFRGDCVSDALYWIDYKPFSALTPMEKQAWHLFISICRKSTQLYLYFENRTKQISKEEVEEGMIEVKASEVVAQCLQFSDEMCALAK